ncbi:hypothetical protein GCK32_018092, partial [Trichostrongylus colubriformis]
CTLNVQCFSHPRSGPGTGQPIATLQPDSTSTATHERVTHIIPIQQGSVPTQTQTVIANVPSLAQPRVVQATQVVQKQNDNTFRFAQMGSGGQFTVAPPNERTPTKGTPMVMKTAGTAHVAFWVAVIPQETAVRTMVRSSCALSLQYAIFLRSA